MSQQSNSRISVNPVDADAEIDVRALGRTLWKYKWLVLVFGAVIGVATAGITMRLPKVYAAHASLEFDSQGFRPLGQQVEDVADPEGSYWTTRESFETQLRIMSSRALATRVATQLGLHRDPDFMGVPADERDGFTGASPEAAAGVLRSRLAVSAISGTRLVVVTMEDHIPERAATIANAIADTYIEKTLEDRMAATVAALDWLGEQLESLRTELDESELALHDFKIEHNILSVSMEDRQNLIASEITAFSAALTAARTRRIELDAHAAQLRAEQQHGNLTSRAALFEDDLVIRTLSQELATKQAAREALGVRYGDAHPQMQQLAREIEAVERRLGETIGAAVAASAARLEQARRVERGLASALDGSTTAGLALNLREIEYERLNRQRASNSQLYDVVLQRATETDLTRMLRTTNVRVVDRAAIPGTALRPNVPKSVALGLAVGLFLGIGVALFLGWLDRRVNAVEDIEGIGVPVLGAIPPLAKGAETGAFRRMLRRREPRPSPSLSDPERDLFVYHQPKSLAAEAIRVIRTNLTFMSPDEPIRTLVVTSSRPAEGKTTIALNGAVALAQSGKRVLLVDTDLRRPRIRQVFGLKDPGGLTNLLASDMPLRKQARSTHISGLDVLPSGPLPPNPSELLHSRRMSEIIAEALERYDTIILDTPPIGAVSDALVLAPQVDGAMLIVRAGETTIDDVRSANRQLRGVGARVVGAVVNDVQSSATGYGYQSAYGYSSDDSIASSGADEDAASGAAAAE